MTLSPKKKKSNSSKFIRSVYKSGVQYVITVPINWMRELTSKEEIEGTFKLVAGRNDKARIEIEAVY